MAPRRRSLKGSSASSIPSPVITEGLERVYGSSTVPSTLGHGKGLGVDPMVTRFDLARGGVVYNLDDLDAAFPSVKALIHLFKSRNLTIRKAMAVIAQTESAWLNASVN